MYNRASDIYLTSASATYKYDFDIALSCGSRRHLNHSAAAYGPEMVCNGPVPRGARLSVAAPGSTSFGAGGGCQWLPY